MIMMFIVAVISLLIGFILTFYVGMVLDMNNRPSILAPLLFCSTLIGTTALLVSITPSSDAPKAIEVYQGKTTLQVTYQNSIAIDSIVVYKNTD